MTKPLYFYNGTTFEQIGPTTPQSPIAYQTSAPTGPATGDLWIDSDGDVDTYNRQLTRYYFVATAAQTTITGTDANGLTLAYVAGSEAVYVNGALQVRGQDYTATNGTSVVMTAALAVNDVVEIFAYTAFTVANAYTKSETDGVAAAAAGLRMVVPTSVAVGSGTGSVDATGNVTFSGASSVSLNGCFTDTYDNYLIVVSDVLSSASTPEVYLRLRVSGADSTTGYYYGQHYALWGSASGGFVNLNNGGYFSVMAANTTVPTASQNWLQKPFLTKTTTHQGLQVRYDAASYVGGYNSATTSYTGFSLVASSNTISGIVRVYGYKD
jgi:hypothetical protein